MPPVCLVEELESAQREMIKSAFVGSLPWLVLWLILITVGFTGAFPVAWAAGGVTVGQALIGLSAVPAFVTLKFWYESYSQRKTLQESQETRDVLREAERSSSVQEIQAIIEAARNKGDGRPLVKARLDEKLPVLMARIKKLRTDEAYATLNANVQKTTREIGPFLIALKNDLPIVKALAQIKVSLEFLERRREELQQQWEAAYERFSWWNKLKYSGGPDFSEIDRMIKDLRFMDRQMERKHGEDFVAIEKHFETARAKAISRVLDAKGTAESFIREIDGEASVGSGVLRKSMWLGMLSIPVSVWFDADRAANVFDAVRSVNGEFVGMSDAEIWWQTLFLPTESLSGLAALTKGAYFEQLVAADTGGQIHEHFNHPNTDIVVDGTAFQIKATDSESYVNSVADGIPVIATSEVAMATGSIDSGFSNEELSNTVDLALGSTVVDIGDTAVDAILAGVGGLGFFATLEGLNHAVKKHENGGDGVEAIFEGAGVAIEGTARALVGAAEMSYKVLSSKPSRFVGRMMLKGLVKLDEKMTRKT